MEERGIAEVASAYVAYVIWFLGEGIEAHRRQSETLREQLSEPLSKLMAAVQQGPDALTSALSEQELADMQAKVGAFALEQHPAQWACNRVNDILSASGQPGWELLKAIVAQAPDNQDVLGFIGAGPFETWVNETRVRECAADLEATVRQDSKMRAVVLSSWDVPPALESILERCGVRR